MRDNATMKDISNILKKSSCKEERIDKIVFISTKESLKEQKKKIIAAFESVRDLREDQSTWCEVELNVLYTLENRKKEIFTSIGHMAIDNVGKEIFHQAVHSVRIEPSMLLAKVFEYVEDGKNIHLATYLMIGI